MPLDRDDLGASVHVEPARVHLSDLDGTLTAENFARFVRPAEPEGVLAGAKRWARGVLAAHRAQLDAWTRETYCGSADLALGWAFVNEAARRAAPHSQLWLAAKLLQSANEYRQRLAAAERAGTAGDGAKARREAAHAARCAAFASQWHLLGQLKRDIEPSALSGVRQRKAGAMGGRSRAALYAERDHDLAALWDEVERDQPAWSRVAIAVEVANRHKSATGTALAPKTVQNIAAKTPRK